jgi:hypothetical protein
LKKGLASELSQVYEKRVFRVKDKKKSPTNDTNHHKFMRREFLG